MPPKVSVNQAEEQLPSNPDLPQDQSPNGSPPTKREPSGKSTTLPIASTMAARMKHMLKTPDSFILHLNSLLLPARDLSSVISTLTYILGAVAFFYLKADHLKHRLFAGRQADQAPFQSSFMAAMASLFWRARLTLRLFGLLPVYVRARQILHGADGQEDRMLSTTALLQCLLYGASYLLENVAFLTDSKVLSKHLKSRLTMSHGGSIIPIYTLAYRAWFLGVSCEIVRLFRELQLMSKREDKPNSSVKMGTDDSRAALWDSKFLIPLAWFPIGWQFTAWIEESIPGFNIGLHGAACVLADVEKTITLWTKSPSV